MLFALVLGLSWVSAFAADDSTLLSNEEKLIHQKARARAYVGGIDEEPLKVQAQLPSPTRKMQPAQEPVEATDSADTPASPSND